MRIIGIKINEGYPAVIKNLKPGGWYPFGDYNEPTENNKWIWEKDNDDELLSSIYKYATDESFPDGLRISVSCIVGQNGSGKTNVSFTAQAERRSAVKAERFCRTAVNTMWQSKTCR